MIRHSLAINLGMDIKPTSHTASQADGKTKLKACGEIHVTLTQADISFSLQAVCMQDLDCDILAGVPFMRENNIVLDLPKDRLIVQGKPITYESRKKASSIKSFLLRANCKEVLYPGDYLEIQAPTSLKDDVSLAVEPRTDGPLPEPWLCPDITKCVDGIIRLVNSSNSPVAIQRNQHIAQAYYTSSPEDLVANAAVLNINPPSSNTKCDSGSSTIVVDPNQQLSTTEQRAFHDLHARYAMVFQKSIGMYNDRSGKLRATINMGPVEPPA